jgi:CO/xanthine dehydrogenase Mo-binding subunit
VGGPAERANVGTAAAVANAVHHAAGVRIRQLPIPAREAAGGLIAVIASNDGNRTKR